MSPPFFPTAALRTVTKPRSHLEELIPATKTNTTKALNADCHHFFPTAVLAVDATSSLCSPVAIMTVNSATINTASSDGAVTNIVSIPSFRLQLISSNNTPVNIYSAPTTEAHDVIDTVMPWGYICLQAFPTHLHPEHYMLANGGYISISLVQGQSWLFHNHPAPTSILHSHYLQLSYPTHCDSSSVLKWWITNLAIIIHKIYFEGWQYHPLDIEYWLGLRGVHDDCIIVEDYEDRGRPRITFLQTAIADSVTNSKDPHILVPAHICIANAFLTEVAAQYMEICMCRQFHEPLDTCIVHNETRCLPFSHPHLQASSHSHDNSKAGGLDKEVLRFPRLIQSLPQREIGTSSENEDNHSEISDEEDIYDNTGMGTGCMSMTEALHYLHTSDDNDVAKRAASLRRATIERLESIRGKMPPRTTTTVYFDNPHDLSRTYLEDALRHLNDLDDQDGEFSDSSSNYCPSFDGEEGYHWDPWSRLQ